MAIYYMTVNRHSVTKVVQSKVPHYYLKLLLSVVL